jgi:transcriptional regulator, tetR family
MPKSMTITKEIIIKTAFEMVRKEGFAVLSARNIAKKIGCSTQPIYWSYKNMDDLKAEICQKALSHLKNTMCQYKKTGNPFLDLGLGYVHMAHIEPALFKAVYIDNIMKVKMTDIIPENKEVIELMKNTEDFQKMSDKGIKNIFSRSWMLAHGIASLVAVGMFVYDEEKILEIIRDYN